jgi:hypothetical protein
MTVVTRGNSGRLAGSSGNLLAFGDSYGTTMISTKCWLDKNAWPDKSAWPNEKAGQLKMAG